MAAFATLVPDRCSRNDPKYLKAAVDRRLRTLVPGLQHSDELASALRHSLLAPGKRIRPLLTILAAWEVGDRNLRALDAGCALELVHAASLILDDMPAMDNAQQRRGLPATHVRFGEDVAMLAAIALLSLAYGTIGAMQHIPGETRCRLVGILARAVGMEGLAGGQYADLRPDAVRSVQAASETNRRKTGALFIAAVEMATAIHGTAEKETAGLHRCAGEFGQAYQIFDDLTDGGQASGGLQPEDSNKSTVMSFVGTEDARRRLRNHLDSALDGLRPTGPLAGYIRTLLEHDPVDRIPA